EIVFEKDDEAEEKPKKKLPTSEIIRRVVLTVSLVAIVISSGMLINEWRLSKQNDNIMEEVSGLIIDEKENDPAKPEEDKELTPEQQWKKIKKEYPNVIFPEGMQVKYAKLYATNPEFVGYLSADGVNLNLPVVQSKDDRKYLEKNFYLQKTKYGCPFVTHLNNIDPLDQNTVIFGHHMNNGTIFGTLDAYKSIEGFKKAPVITFNTLYKDYKWKVIAAIVTNAYTKDDNGYIFRYYFTQLSTQENFSAYLSELSQRSLYDTGVDVLPTDKLLTLSTCSHEFTDARFVVIARLVRPGESADVDVSRATVNSNPRYPQAWYNKKGKTNPYKNAFQWEVS
ncbi:MAG: class B sortase, partial [Clostridia bacterium]|nr:class B sortase [Clostridia bacterium]